MHHLWDVLVKHTHIYIYIYICMRIAFMVFFKKSRVEGIKGLHDALINLSRPFFFLLFLCIIKKKGTCIIGSFMAKIISYKIIFTNKCCRSCITAVIILSGQKLYFYLLF